MEPTKAVYSLRPNSPHFLDTVLLAPFLQHYGIDLEEVNSECMNARNFFMRDPPSGNQLHDILEKLNPVSAAFPALTKSLIIAMTFGTSTASVDHSFSSLRRIKSYLCSTMSQE